MGEIHQLVLKVGRDAARLQSTNGEADIAAKVMADENRDTDFAYTGFALTAFPYRKLETDDSWTKEGHNVTLTVDPGSLKVNGKVKKFGVPYGASARLVLIYLQSEAVRTANPTVTLGRSLRTFATDRLGLEWGGSTGKALQDQIYRLSACSLKFFWSTASHDQFEAPRLIRSGSLSVSGATDDPQTRLWDDTVTLAPEFFGHLQQHAVPLLDAAVRALADEPVALDMYIWLAYRLRSLDKPQRMSWASLRDQFGAGYKTVRQFKYKAAPSLRRALAAYPEATVTIDDKEIILHPSRPPIARLR